MKPQPPPPDAVAAVDKNPMIKEQSCSIPYFVIHTRKVNSPHCSHIPCILVRTLFPARLVFRQFQISSKHHDELDTRALTDV